MIISFFLHSNPFVQSNRIVWAADARLSWAVARLQMVVWLSFLVRVPVGLCGKAQAVLADQRWARAFRMRMLRSLAVRMGGYGSAPPAGCWRGRGVRGG